MVSLTNHRRISIDDNWFYNCVFYSTYLTNLRTVDEIGVSFLTECDCYLGEIVLKSKVS